MSPIDRIKTYADALTALRRDLHAHPELGFEEVRTSGIVADLLEGYGIEVHRGIGGTGVVGVLKGRSDSGRRIGLRADMDALPIEEETNLPYRSTYPGKMHACGHDGHTTMLVGAARYLAETRDFDGTAVFVFQPAEEGRGGARAMLADGLFEKFPCDEIYGLHNQPSGPHGAIGLRPGPIMAAADFFDIRVQGRGIHAAQPHKGIDPIVIITGLAQAMQSIVSRNADPLKSIVVSITRLNAGSAYNVVPESADMAGTIRTFDRDLRALAARRIRELAAGFAAAYGAEIGSGERPRAEAGRGRDRRRTVRRGPGQHQRPAPHGQRGLRRHGAQGAGRLRLARLESRTGPAQRELQLRRHDHPDRQRLPRPSGRAARDGLAVTGAPDPGAPPSDAA